jgi:hypothetical protein
VNVEELSKACRDLSIRPDPLGYITDPQTCAVLKVSKRTLSELRRRGDGPAYIQLGGRIRYRLTDIAAWYTALERRTTQTTADRAAARLARRRT